MQTLKKYKTAIFNFITIFLIIEFVIFPGLTTANTFLNIMAGIGTLLLVLWGGISLYEYVKNSEGLVDSEELKEAKQMMEQSNEEFAQKDEFQIKAGIKGDFYKSKNIPPEILKEMADSWREKLEDADPLAAIPMSRVSHETKKLIAQMAKDDIQGQLEKNEVNFSKIKNIAVNKTKTK